MGKTSLPLGTTITSPRLSVSHLVTNSKFFKVSKLNACPFALLAQEFPNKFDNMGVFLTTLYFLVQVYWQPVLISWIAQKKK